MTGKKKFRPYDILMTSIIWFFSLLVFGILLWIIGYILMRGLSHINWDFITTLYKPSLDQFGILPMIVSTLVLILITLVIILPIGIFAAIYLAEYAKEGKVVKTIRFAMETLAGIPSIIYGLFGYVFFVVALKMDYSLLAGALTLSIMVLPTITRTVEVALKSVPDSFREGSLALGATSLQTIVKVILPSAIPGIMTAVMLSIGRIVGETAAVYLTAGYVARIPTGIFSSGRTLSVHLYQLAKEGISMEQSFATAAVLCIIILLLNFASGAIAARMGRKWKS
jgi:phosphate transport system permease protein